MKLTKEFLFIVFIFALSLLLRTYHMSSVMQFIPDQGWFYLSARDMILTGNIPLVGPPTSHPWIHHGPLWTYALAVIFLISNFDPVFPAYFIGVLGSLTVLIFYYCIKRMFGNNTAVLCAILFACAPLIVMNSRIAYHTSPIPFFVILLFFLVYKWLKGAVIVFPIICFLLGVLYNHEITTFVYFICVGILFIYGLFARKIWVQNILKVKILFLSCVSFLIPMTPFIVHDIQNGYGQTLKFLVWVGYRLVKAPLSIFHPSFASSGSNPSTFGEFFTYYSQLVYLPNILIPIVVAAITVLYILFNLKDYIFIKKYANNFKLGLYTEKINTENVLLSLFLGVGFVGLLSHRVPIEADTLLIAPFLIILSAKAIRWITNRKFKSALAIVLFISVGNVYYLFYTDFLTQNTKNNRISYSTRLQAIDKIVSVTGEKSYTIVGRGELSSFPVFLMPYEYLLWWKGKPVSKDKPEAQIFEIWEDKSSVKVTKIK